MLWPNVAKTSGVDVETKIYPSVKQKRWRSKAAKEVEAAVAKMAKEKEAAVAKMAKEKEEKAAEGSGGEGSISAVADEAARCFQRNVGERCNGLTILTSAGWVPSPR